MNNKRFIAVLCPLDPVKTDVAGRILKPLLEANIPDVKIFAVCRSKFGFKHDGVEVIEVDDQTAETDAKLKNFVIRKFYAEHGSSDAGWLYLMDQSLEIIDTNGFPRFFTDLERMLNVFGMNAWLNTRTDSMNYVFDRYNPRYTVAPDDGVMDVVLGSESPIHWTSHANALFMALNLAYDGKQVEQRFLFNENFAIPMYYIVDWICRQKEENEKTDDPDFHWHWMNLYPTVESEGGLFKITDWKKSGLDQSSWREPGYREDPSRSDFAREQELFDSYRHDFAFATNPDPVFKFMYRHIEDAMKKMKGAEENKAEKEILDNA